MERRYRCKSAPRAWRKLRDSAERCRNVRIRTQSSYLRWSIKWARQSIFHNKMHSEEKVPHLNRILWKKSYEEEYDDDDDERQKISDNQIIPESSFDPDLFGGDENTFGNVDDSIGTLILDEKLCGRLRRKLQIRWMNSKLPSMGSWVQSPDLQRIQMDFFCFNFFKAQSVGS